MRTQVRHRVGTVGVLGLWLLAVACAATPAARAVHLIVLHTNDIHGQVLPRRATWKGEESAPEVGGLPRVASAIHRIRADESGPATAVLAFDCGDWFQGTPEGGLDGGRGFVRALALVGYEAAALGNHEFDLGLEHLRELLEGVAPRAICANLLEADTGERVDWIEPWRVIERAGLTIAVVSVLTPETPEITHSDARTITFQDPARALAAVLAELPEEVDLVIPLAHLDIDEARAVARAHPELPLILSGHSHTFLRQGVTEGDTLIVQAGEKATVLGRVDLWIDPDSLEVLEARAQLIDLLEPPLNHDGTAALRALCEDLAARAEAQMGISVGTLAAPLSRGSGPRSTLAATWVADVIRARTGADVAVHNRGGTRTELAAGPVTRRDLFELLPFANHLVTVTLSGAELQAMVRQAVEGTAHSGLDYSGLRAFVRVGESVTLERVEVGGRALEPAARYRVSVNSFLASGGDSFEMLAAAPQRAVDPILLWELAALAFERSGTIHPPRDERIVHVEELP